MFKYSGTRFTQLWACYCGGVKQMRELHDQCFVSLFKSNCLNISYKNLLYLQLRYVIFSFDMNGSLESVRPSADEEHSHSRGIDMARALKPQIGDMFKFARALSPDLQSCKKDSRESFNDEVLQMWVLLMVKGLVWAQAHTFVTGKRFPSKHYGSQMPVWLT